MKLAIPSPLQQEHEVLQDELRRAILMYPHFVSEDKFALPPLGQRTDQRSAT